MSKLVFHKNKLALITQMDSCMMDDVQLEAGCNNADFMRNTFTLKLTAGFMAAMNETKTITVQAKRPSFLDWLLRRKRSFVFTVNSKEVLKNPPVVHGNVLIYEVTENRQPEDID